MMNSTKFSALLGALALAATTHSIAIELGDPAPPLSISSWVKGKPVDLKSNPGKHVYVMEFWATWCGPCLTSIPHLSKIQTEFKDKNVTIIGISSETTAKVSPFVKRMGDKMDYTVAVDKDNATYKAYMEAFGEGGIPHAFVVDQKGKLAWHGNPMEGLDSVIEQVLAGTYDVATARKADRAKQLLSNYLQAVYETKPSPEIEKQAWQAVDDGASNTAMLDDFAWTLLTNPRIQYRDLKLATTAAKKAYDVSQAKDPSIIDTYARALFDTGKKNQAIQLQKKAIAICTDNDLKSGLEQTLERYQKTASK
jgi:peroxiredoxin